MFYWLRGTESENKIVKTPVIQPTRKRISLQKEKQPPKVFFKEKCSEKFRQIHRKTLETPFWEYHFFRSSPGDRFCTEMVWYYLFSCNNGKRLRKDIKSNKNQQCIRKKNYQINYQIWKRIWTSIVEREMNLNVHVQKMH